MDIAAVTAIVTGGASGLGAATARHFASQGARVAILDLERSAGADTAAAIGGATIFCPADVSDEAAVRDALDRAENDLGSIGVNVNCAGIGWASRILGKGDVPHDLAAFRKVVDVNLVGTFNVMRLCAERMAKREPDANGERGVIVNTASIAAYEGQIGQVAYSASKGGIVGMTLPVARDLSKLGIRVCAIAPGLFETPLLMSLPESAREALAAGIPFPSRLGQPPEFAALALQIAENPMLNGEVIRLDGALRMAPR